MRIRRNATALIEGISRVERVRLFSEMRGAQDKDDAAQQIKSLRKMLLVMVGRYPRRTDQARRAYPETLHNLSGVNPDQ